MTPLARALRAHRDQASHHQRSKVVEDVSQRDENCSVSVEPPEGAVSLQQPVLLWTNIRERLAELNSSHTG